MRYLLLSAILCVTMQSASAQGGSTRGGLSAIGGVASGRSVPTLDQKLAALEEAAANLQAEIKAIRAELKKDAKSSEVKVFILKNSHAAETAKLLSEVFGRDGVRVSTDTRTNSLVCYATSDRLEVIQALVARLEEAEEKKPEAKKSK